MHLYKHSHAPGLSNLWVVTTVFNPARFKSRYDLYQRFRVGCERVGVNLLTVELALGDRPFEVTEPGNARHVQLRTRDELWHKETCLNIGISRLPQDWQYVAWIDADVEILRHDWPAEICHLLQQYQVIQLFDTAIDLGHDGRALRTEKSFVATWHDNSVPKRMRRPGSDGSSGTQWHPGYAWAYRRDAIGSLGGLIDVAILGSADAHMAWALIGQVDDRIKGIPDAYLRHLKTWEDRASKHVKRNIGFMPGTLAHHWHGSKKQRYYESRYEILQKHQYNPDWDLKRDWQGLWTFTDSGERMRNDLRAYGAARNEDSAELWPV